MIAKNKPLTRLDHEKLNCFSFCCCVGIIADNELVKFL